MNTIRILKDLVPYRATYTVEKFPDLTGRVYIVTGASGGLGLQVARKLIQKNAKVYLLAKTEKKLVAAVEELKKDFPENAENIHYSLVDYADLATLKPAVDAFLSENNRLDGVVHNAGTNFAPKGSKTAQGIEFTLGVNSVAPFLLQKYLDSILETTAKIAPENSVRIVWVSSSAHRLSIPAGGINLDDLNDAPGGFHGLGVYGQSKAINLYEAVVWPRIHKESKVISVAVHPGVVGTDLARNITENPGFGRYLMYTPEKGAYAELYPLLHPSITIKDTGKYYVPFGQTEHPRQDVYDGANGEAGLKLWNWLDEQVKDFI